ncbi:hypothetical protein HMPREF3039_02461 [Akkermansia sp. KLE1798]|nr:hypothetical protein HMPREF3039_02461 [Akkermansia sp. KLE1798]
MSPDPGRHGEKRGKEKLPAARRPEAWKRMKKLFFLPEPPPTNNLLRHGPLKIKLRLHFRRRVIRLFPAVS